jgi:hypothetical protein
VSKKKRKERSAISNLVIYKTWSNLKSMTGWDPVPAKMQGRVQHMERPFNEEQLSSRRTNISFLGKVSSMNLYKM